MKIFCLASFAGKSDFVEADQIDGRIMTVDSVFQNYS